MTVYLLIILHSANVLGTGPKMIRIPMPSLEACLASRDGMLTGDIATINKVFCTTEDKEPINVK